MLAEFVFNRRPPRVFIAIVLVAGWLTVCHSTMCGFANELAASDQFDRVVDFDRDVRPILSDHCFKCHGPDQAKLQAGLRLDQQASLVQPSESGETPVVPGAPQQSELIRRITSSDADLRMPPAEEGKNLSEQQLQILTQWVAEGAAWSKHWAFEPVRQPAVPTVALDAAHSNNSIDAFVLAKLQEHGLQPAPRDTRAGLIRRVTLDLTGLPPSLADVDAFLLDQTPDAFEKVVDRLLCSQHFGERLAVPWLDLARYGDTSGYHNDSLRDMWLWREWVIKAFNDNLPFDQFTTEQLAGDLLPAATIEQQVASGFHRNVMTSDEGGLIDAEYRNLYVVDRVATTGVTWLGLTVACAQCHDHKYDPITQADFYKLYAFFNNVPENGKDGVRDRNPKPFLQVPSPADAAHLQQFDTDLANTELELSELTKSLSEQQAAWEQEFVVSNAATQIPAATVHFPLDDDGAALFAADCTAIPTVSHGPVQYADAAVGRGFKTDGKAWLETDVRLDFTKKTPFSISAYLSVNRGGGAPIGQMDDAHGSRGWDIEFHGLRPSVHLIHRWPDDVIHIQADEDFPAEKLTHVSITYDGSGKAAGLKLYVGGALAKSSVKVDKLKGEITNSLPLSIGRRGPASTNFHGLIDDVRIYQRELSAVEITAQSAVECQAIARIPADQRSDQQRQTLEQFFQHTQLPQLAALKTKVETLRKEKQEFEKKVPNTMVMSELDTPRTTFIKVRGNYDQDGQAVVAAVPSFLPQIPAREDSPLNRLDLARWLTSPTHPLTARVAVNRWWAMLFGTGLVKTLNDFGSQGERPSHPELLDWLAADFMRDWDMKRAIKQMVMSATYQQAAQVSPKLFAMDTENRLLARGPRQRLDAEFLRDNALAIAGVLNPAIGGKSIKPAQPAGTWEINEMSGYSYDKSQGADLYRRGLYVYWRRSTVYPSFVTLDAPTREFCVSQRVKTSTPLQSLVLMNDPVFVEAARGLAQRILADANTDQTARLTRAWRLALSRPPTAAELAILEQTLLQQLETFRANPQAAEQLNSVGDLPTPETLAPVEVAAWTAVSNVILNLNETISN